MSEEEHRSYRRDTLVYDSRLDILKDTRTGSVVIVGNGPSAGDYDLERVPYPLFGTNIAWKLPVSRFAHYAILDRVHLEREYVRNHPGLFNGSRTTEPYGIRVRPWMHTAFSLDLTRGHSMGNVVGFAMECSVWIGYRDIHVVGLDLGTINGRGHFDGSDCADGIIGQNEEFKRAASILAAYGVRVRVTGAPIRRCTAFPHETFEQMLREGGAL